MNIVRPGKHAHLDPGPAPARDGNAVNQFLDNVPKSFVGPFEDQPNTIGPSSPSLSVPERSEEDGTTRRAG